PEGRGGDDAACYPPAVRSYVDGPGDRGVPVPAVGRPGDRARRALAPDGRMSESLTKLVEARISALIERVYALAAERDDLLREISTLQSRVDAIEGAAKAARDRDVSRLERENTRLRSALEGAVRELSEEA